jgi:hypothetical protein
MVLPRACLACWKRCQVAPQQQQEAAALLPSGRGQMLQEEVLQGRQGLQLQQLGAGMWIWRSLLGMMWQLC